MKKKYQIIIFLSVYFLQNVPKSLLNFTAAAADSINQFDFDDSLAKNKNVDIADESLRDYQSIIGKLADKFAPPPPADSVDKQPPPQSQSIHAACTMGSCFNMKRCSAPFKVHIYPAYNSTLAPVSEIYNKILSAVRTSPFYTDLPSEACLFLLSLDTLDRDKLSQHYVPNLQNLMDTLLPPDIWQNGMNHLLFSMYHGSYPSYEFDDLGIKADYSIMARASTSIEHYRVLFDVALPLFHADLPLRDQTSSAAASDTRRKPYLLAFKGKRYVYGIGSETRNMLYHLHNGRDVIMLLTCKHGKDWQSMQDARCALDNDMYDKWDYEALLTNSTFCLVPRGRRLGSYRFLESLRAGCIPVVVADDWLLPFTELIDWSRAVLVVKERLLFLIPEMLRSLPAQRITEMQLHCKQIFHQYFSSVEKIVHTTLEVIKQRVDVQKQISNKQPINPSPSKVDRQSMEETWPKSVNLLEHWLYDEQQNGMDFKLITVILHYNTLDTNVDDMIQHYLNWTHCHKVLLLMSAEVRNQIDRSKFVHKPSDRRLEYVEYEKLGSVVNLVKTAAVVSVNLKQPIEHKKLSRLFTVWSWFPWSLVQDCDMNVMLAHRHYLYLASHQFPCIGCNFQNTVNCFNEHVGSIAVHYSAHSAINMQPTTKLVQSVMQHQCAPLAVQNALCNLMNTTGHNAKCAKWNVESRDYAQVALQRKKLVPQLYPFPLPSMN